MFLVFGNLDFISGESSIENEEVGVLRFVDWINWNCWFLERTQLMARISEGILQPNSSLSLTLDRYQEIMGLPIKAFNGLNDPDEQPVYECSHIWKQTQRDYLAIHVMRAEERREHELQYHLSPKYITAERHQYKSTVILDRKHFIQAGLEASTLIDTVTLDYRDDSNAIIDPLVLTVTTTVTSTDEIVVKYPDEDVRITPSNISISGGVATIKIPRARLVKPSLLDNRDAPLQFVADSNFLETVDVYRVYNDPANAILLTWTSVQLALLGVVTFPNGSEQTQTAVGALDGERSKRISQIEVFPATYSNGVWTGACLTYRCPPERVDVSYKSGIATSMEALMLTAKLSHTLMPNMPCTCPYVEQYWREDREQHPQGLVTPYGGMVGQVEAWLADSRAKVGLGGMFR